MYSQGDRLDVGSYFRKEFHPLSVSLRAGSAKIAASVIGQELAYLPSATSTRRLYCSNERFGNFHKTSLTNLITETHTSVLHFPAMVDSKFSEWWWRELRHFCLEILSRTHYRLGDATQSATRSGSLTSVIYILLPQSLQSL
jgi:hypothetical protein